MELEKEIAKFRVENQTLSQLRVEREKDLKTLRKEIDAFQKEKNEELNRINEYREEEMKKIKIERKVFDKYQKVARTIPNKKERDEIKNLKEEVDYFTFVVLLRRHFFWQIISGKTAYRKFTIPLASTPQNGQTHSICRQRHLTILWVWHLKGYSFKDNRLNFSKFNLFLLSTQRKLLYLHIPAMYYEVCLRKAAFSHLGCVNLVLQKI